MFKRVNILLEVKCKALEVMTVVQGDYAIKFHVRSKLDGFRWALVAVYGAGQPEFKPDFLAALVWICVDEKLPLLVGEDFNIIRRRERKRTMIILTAGGRSCLIPLLKAWI